MALSQGAVEKSGSGTLRYCALRTPWLDASVVGRGQLGEEMQCLYSQVFII